MRPFSSRRQHEIIAAPKVYGFDTGFVCYHRGWYTLRAEDRGVLWEHFVLNEIQAHLQTRDVRYWRDKRGHEIDFIIARRGRQPVAIECKWSIAEFDTRNTRAFLTHYPKATVVVVAHDVTRRFTRRTAELSVTYMSLPELLAVLAGNR